MAKTASVYARIEPEVKEQAEQILTTLGIPASNAINMFYKQIILQSGLPFDVKIPRQKMLIIDELSDDQFYQELDKGYQAMKEGHVKSAEQVFLDIRKKISNDI